MKALIQIIFVYIIQKIFVFVFHPFFELIRKLKKINAKQSECKNRFDFFDLYKSQDLSKIGIFSNQKQWNLELPSQNKCEKVSIFGMNSWGQSLKLVIDWKPETTKTSKMRVGFTFEDGKGNTFIMNEQNMIPFDKTKREYKAPGISLEVLSPFKRLRIKFRGFLSKKGTNELTFVKMRILWLSTSSIFDFECNHRKDFIEKELKNNSKKFEEIKFENRFEQLGQMKGTVQFEAQNEENIFLWGTKSKKYDEPEENRKIYRLFGYSKKGWVFHIGTVVDNKRQLSYRYGFAFWGKNFICPIDSLTNIDIKSLSLNQELAFSLTVEQKIFDISIVTGLQNTTILPIKVNGFEGKAIFTFEDELENRKQNETFFKNQIYFPFVSETNELVLPINDRKAENVLLSGGKGSSLASLNYMSKEIQNIFNIEVPKGIIVTCNAYKLLLEQNKQITDSIDKMKSIVSKNDLLKKESQNVVNGFKTTVLSQEIKDQIWVYLKIVFKDKDLNNISFAVRSSASGEDSEEMSAAGQMTTYLGVKGMDAIYSAVLKCWSSQFELVAIEYKRGYGQDLNSLMAVVIQEMIDCDSAGVLFTCDPLTGNERELIITANYGIGESVVSATAEPDTIRVGINIKDNSFNERTFEAIKSISIGSKSKSIKMDCCGDGTVEVERVDTNQCSLSDDNIKRLTNIALEIQNFFGSVRDIEWGIKDNQIFILQSRPITNLDSGFNEFELMHELDAGLPSEKEYLTKANVGEVLAGCSSALATNFGYKLWVPIFMKVMHEEQGIDLNAFCPYGGTDIVTVYNHAFLNLKNSEFLRLSNEGQSNYCKSMILSIFGHQLDPEIIEECKEVCDPDPLSVRFWRNFFLIPFMVSPEYYLNQNYKHIHCFDNIFNKKFNSANDLFDLIERNAYLIMEDVMVHMKTSESSSMLNYALITILSENKNNPNIFVDFALLLSHCGQLVSADVPSALRELAQSIDDPKLFRELSAEKAIEYLQNKNNKCNKHFDAFIKKHGHRGYKEFDPLAKSWRDDPIPVIQSLKTMLSEDASVYKANAKKSTAEIIDSLQTSLSYTRKLLLKYLLPIAQRGVAMREASKSLTIYAMDIFRKGFWQLANTIHSEGLIPEPQLMFHMSPDEIKDLLQNRNPMIVWKAKQRKRLHTKMNNWKFDEIISGYDFKPRELMENTFSQITGKEVIKGTPVSVGQIVAKVCVAPNLEDAVHIQSGDILVTYSTDIGWSPYFPMISGIVTEIGGLISHGAVIAREYGLPCLVGANGACHFFKTGDMVALDCQKGIITRVDNNNQQNGKH